MSNRIDQAQVANVAKLARLDMTEQEISQFTTELSAILEYIEKLNELNVDNVEPLAHCLPMHNVFRNDEPTPSLDVAQAMKNAPDRADNYFKVPKILDDNSGA